MSVSFTPSMAHSTPAVITNKQPIRFGNQVSSSVRNASHEKELSDVFNEGVQHLKEASRTNDSARFRDYSVGLKALQELINNMKSGNDSRVLVDITEEDALEEDDGLEVRASGLIITSEPESSGLIIATEADMPDFPEEEKSFWGKKLEVLEAERNTPADQADPVQFGERINDRHQTTVAQLEAALEKTADSIAYKIEKGSSESAANDGNVLSGIASALSYLTSKPEPRQP